MARKAVRNILMVSYDENEYWMLRHSVQNDRANLDLFHCEGSRHVRDT
jgi:hypothetical protein